MPAPAALASWAVKYGPMLLPVAKRMYDAGRFRQLAILHARTLEDGTFSWEMYGGERIWVVWTGEEVVATYPELGLVGDDPFPGARPDRRQDPDDVLVRRVRRTISSGLRRGGDADEPGLLASDDTTETIEVVEVHRDEDGHV